MTDPIAYDRLTKRLHWITAAIIPTMWLLAQVIDFFPRDLRVWPRSTHILLGVALLGIYLLRLTWRITGGTHLPPAGKGPLDLLAKAVHVTLYVLLATTVLAGLGYTFLRGDNILNLFRLPKLFADIAWLKESVGDVHALGANAILILAAIHATAALVHHYIWKDGVLRRMLPARS